MLGVGNFICNFTKFDKRVAKTIEIIEKSHIL
jgi:hypothetical protein